MPYQCSRCGAKKGTVLERAIQTTSEIFGPAGDHHGLRDRWEAYCVNRGIKSTIGNYRDNRFSALFQTSAEIILHHEDFLEVLSTCKQPNLKLKSVEADLKSDTICSMMRIFGLIFLKVTGPYWNLITLGCVAYLELYHYFQDLRYFLDTCIENPSSLFKADSHWLEWSSPFWSLSTETVNKCTGHWIWQWGDTSCLKSNVNNYWQTTDRFFTRRPPRMIWKELGLHTLRSWMWASFRWPWQ